ncbi:TlpA disulfide reductase family protein [Pedobacter nyackensis]|uniref:TlpA disulfide reductase family protein n=1 Tax=Pedobacter nyackensis TaxID=475255 RepID=UPI0029310AA4|nr:TlpA disulfide reductase family protein [Pedobacter nyackensis]
MSSITTSALFTGLIFQGLLAIAQNNYTINGKLSNVKDGEIINLMENSGNIFVTIASDTVKNGKFNFSGKIKESTELALIGNSADFPSKWLSLWVGPKSAIQISGNNYFLNTWNVISKDLRQQELGKYTASTKQELDSIQNLSVQVGLLFQKMNNASAAELKTIKFQIDSLRTIESVWQQKVFQKEISILKTAKVSDIWFKKMTEMAMDVRYNEKSSFRPAVTSLFNKLTPQQKLELRALEISNYLYPPVVVKKGESMVDTILKDLNGKNHMLKDYKGKYLLLDFWSVACGPCMMAMPELRQLDSTAKDKILIVSISMDTKKEIWEKVSLSEKISWLNLSDGKGMTGIAARYGVSGIPHYVVISPEGVVLNSWTGYSKGLLQDKLKSYLE